MVCLQILICFFDPVEGVYYASEVKGKEIGDKFIGGQKD